MTGHEHDPGASILGQEAKSLINASEDIENEVFFGQTVPGQAVESLEGGLSGFSSIATGEIQGEYDQVRDSYSMQRIPTELKLNNSKQGIKGQHRDLAFNL